MTNLDYDINEEIESYMKIYTWPLHEKKLKTKNTNVVILDEKLKSFIELMKLTVKKHNAVGLAAPQVGVNINLIVVDLGEPHVLINPTIIYSEGEQVINEGCLSVPGFYKDRTFPTMIHVHHTTVEGEENVLTFEGIHAAVLQHEMDHLAGKLMTDNLTDEEKTQAQECVNAVITSSPDLYV